MKKLSLSLLARTVVTRRKALKLTQAQLAKSTGMNRSVLSNLESRQYTPSIDQLQALAAELDFDVTEMFVEEAEPYTLSDFSAVDFFCSTNMLVMSKSNASPRA